MDPKSDKKVPNISREQRGGTLLSSPLIKLAIGFLIGCLWSAIAFAEHPVDVQKFSSEGDHFKALTMYELLPDRRLSDDTRIAAA